MQSFDTTTPTPLCKIMGDNKSDKGHTNLASSWHNYTTVYHALFKDMQAKELRVFELGLGTNNVNVPSNMGPEGRPGASLYGWAEFFPKAKIFGADIDRNILFQNERIKTYYCDQTNPTEINKMWNHEDLKENFDIIIEDGLHTYEANVCFFENSIHKLNAGGYYIIEDIHHKDFDSFNDKINEWKLKYPYLSFNLVKLFSPRNPHDNNLLVVQYV